MSRHPSGGTLHTSEEPPRAAFHAGVERLSPGPFTLQIENVGLLASPTALAVALAFSPVAIAVPFVFPFFPFPLVRPFASPLVTPSRRLPLLPLLPVPRWHAVIVHR